MSVDENGSDASVAGDSSPPRGSSSGLPVLRREAIMIHHERGRIATLVAVCSLLGVALGFSLSTMAAAMQAASAGSYHVRVPMMTPGYETPTWLGVVLVDADGGGAHVKRVHANSPASTVGLAAGDVIVAVDGHRVERADALVALIQAQVPGASIALELRRGDEIRTLSPCLANMPWSMARTLR